MITKKGGNKLKTIEDINKIRKDKRAELDLRVNEKATTKEKHILVCAGPRMYII